MQGFLKVLTTGKPGNWQAKTDTSDWHTSMLDPVFARSFTDLMNSRGITFGQHLARALTPFLSGRRHLLDVAGGSGIYKQRFGSGLNRGGQHRPVIRVGQIQFIQVALITIYQTAGGMKIHQFPGSLQVFPRDVRSPPEDRLHPFLMDPFPTIWAEAGHAPPDASEDPAALPGRARKRRGRQQGHSCFNSRG